MLDHDRGVAQAARRRLVARWNISGVSGRGKVGGLDVLPTPAADFSVVDESRLSGRGVAAEADVQTFAGAGDLHDAYPGLCTLGLTRFDDGSLPPNAEERGFAHRSHDSPAVEQV